MTTAALVSSTQAGPEWTVPFELPDWIAKPIFPPAPRNRHERRARERFERLFARRVRKFYARVVARAIVRFGKALRAFVERTECFVPFATFRFSLDGGKSFALIGGGG